MNDPEAQTNLQRLRHILLFWTPALGLWLAFHLVLHKPMEIAFDVLPISLWRVLQDPDWRKGLLLTFTASIACWLVGVCAGYFLGVLTSAVAMDSKRLHPVLRELVEPLQQTSVLLDGLYIIPFVLTTALAYALIMQLVAARVARTFWVAVFLIVVAGLVLGGYNVYRSVYESSIKAKSDSQFLIESLFFKNQFGKWWRRYLRPFSRINKLRDCEIAWFSDSLVIAFHLSIVGVMIVECVIPNFYAYIFGASGQVKLWLGGAGRLVLAAQNNYEFRDIAGCIWAVLIFDWLCSTTIEKWSRRRWLRYYK